MTIFLSHEKTLPGFHQLADSWESFFGHFFWYMVGGLLLLRRILSLKFQQRSHTLLAVSGWRPTGFY